MEKVDENFIKVGSRVVRFMDGQTEIMASGQWALHQSSVSPCGQWQNYKLYRDVERAPKNVFFLTRQIGEAKIHRTHDVMVLEEYYPGMMDWVHSSLNGVVKTAPEFSVKNGWTRKTHQPVDQSINFAVAQGIKNLINLAWEEGKPLSLYVQTRKQGRYAPQILSQELGFKEKDVEFTIDEMIRRGEIEHVTIKGQGRYIAGLALKDHNPPPPHVSSRSAKTNLEEAEILKILDLLKQAWDSGLPMSAYAQTRRQGRYAPANISHELKITESTVINTITMLMRKGFIEYEVANKSTKLKGLRVVKEFSNG